MNARIIKETRALMPAFLTTVGLSMAVSLVSRREEVAAISAIFFGICATFMGAGCFGNEFSNRTMPLLLAQPVPRFHIWRDKLLVLGPALFLAWWIWLTNLAVFNELRIFSPEFIQLTWGMFAVCAGVFCIAPWMVLKSRNTFIGAIMTWGFPYSLVLVALLPQWFFAENILGSRDQVYRIVHPFFVAHPLTNGSLLSQTIIGFHLVNPSIYLAVALIVYFAFCYRRGKRAFENLQAVEMQHSGLALPRGLDRALAYPLKLILPRYTSPISSLIRKEVSLQKPCYFLAAFACALAVIEAALQKLHPSEVLRGLLALNLVLCVGIVPLIATGLSMAEERTLGVVGWQSVLPASARQQWLVKLAVALGTCVLLGVILPLALFILGQEWHIVPIGEPPKSLSAVLDSVTLLGCVIYFSLLAVGLYASSLAKNTFQGIMLTLGWFAGIAAAIEGSIFLVILIFRVEDRVGWRSTFRNSHSSEFDQAIICAEMAVGLVALVWLAYRNFRRENAAGLAWRHAAIFFPALAIGQCAINLAFF